MNKEGKEKMAKRKKGRSKVLDDVEPDLSLQYLPSALRDKLMPFQREGVKFALKKNGRCLIGDEMGLGKTLQAIAVAYHYRQEWPVLVVVPSSLRYQWVEELERWVPELEPSHVHVVSSRDDIRNIATAQVTILGYGLIQREDQPLMKALHDQNFQVIIVDESHYLKNRKAVRTKSLVPLLKLAKRAVLLTGTPALARPAELFPQVDALLPGKFGSWTQFAKRYCDAHRQFYGRFSRWDTNGASNLAELHSNLQPLMIRRLKAQVLTQLPPKRRQRIPFDVPDGQHKKDLDKLAGEWRALIGGFSVPQSHDQPGPIDNSSFQLRQLMVQWYHTTALAKAGSVQEYIKVLLENESMKFIVFGHHKHMLQAVTQTLIHSKVKYIRIDGSVPSVERTHLVQQFQGDPTIRVAVLSILAAGTGLTLTAASHVVFAELYWTPGVLEQAEDRAHRIGQHNAVHVHYLVARNTIDDWMWSMLTRKVSVVTSTLNGKLAKLQAEECGKDQAEFLSRAAVWLPGEQEETDDSFFFSQPSNQKDLRSYFKPKGRKKSGQGKMTAQPSDDLKTDSGADSISLIQEDEEDDLDFIIRDAQKTCRSTKSNVFVIDSDTDSSTESEKVTSQSCDTPTQSDRNVADQSSLIGRKEASRPDVAAPNVSRSEDPGSTDDMEVEDLNSVTVDDDAEQPRWGCALCTFQNHGLLQFCEMCETPRKKEKPTTRSQRRQRDNDFSSPTSKVTEESKVHAARHVKRAASAATGTPKSESDRDETGTDSQEEDVFGPLSGREVKEKCIVKSPLASHSIQNKDTNRSGEVATSHKKSSSSDLIKKVLKRQSENTDIVDLTACSSTEEEDITCETDNATKQANASSSATVTLHGSPKDSISSKSQLDVPPYCRTTSTVQDYPPESSISEELEAVTQVFKPPSRQSTSPWQCENKNCGHRNNDTDAEDCDACFSPRPRKRLKLSSAESPPASPSGTSMPSLSTASTQGTPSRASRSASKPAKERCQNSAMSSSSRFFRSAPNTPQTPPVQRGKPFHTEKQSPSANVKATPPPRNMYKSFALSDSPASGSTSGSPLQGSDWFDDDDISDDLLLSSEKSVSPRGHVARSTSTAGKSQDSRYDLENFSMNADIGTDEQEVDCRSKDPVVKLEDISMYEELQFCASMHTDRIYLYDMDDRPLCCNFSVLDVEQRNMESLPPLLHQPANWRLVLRMVQEWNRLSEPKKRLVRRSARLFISPSLLAEELGQSQRHKAACKNQRYMSKEDFLQRAFKVAEREGGTVQVVSRRRSGSGGTKQGQRHISPNKSATVSSPSSTASTVRQDSTARLTGAAVTSSGSDTAVERNRSTGQKDGDEKGLDNHPRGQVQVVDSAGRPLCLWCQKPVTPHSSVMSDSSLSWQTRFCSTQCKEEYNIRSLTNYSRHQLRDTEFGVCQICGTNMRQIFQQVKELPMSERKAFLKSTPLSSLPPTQLNRIITDPKEGQFWHADHIVPVADGGGLCSLDNYRTLCVMCHGKVTKQQNRQRRMAKQQERRSQDGYRSIMDFVRQ